MIFWWSFAVDGFVGLPLDIRSRPERSHHYSDHIVAESYDS